MAFGQELPVLGLSKWKQNSLKFHFGESLQQNPLVTPVTKPLTNYYGQVPTAFFCRLEAINERKLGIQLLFHAGNYFHDSGFRYW